jgi:hypothetical protein
MFVKLKTGPRMGEIVEMKYVDAIPLIDDGRAQLAFAPDPSPAPIPAAPQPVTTDKAAPRKTKRK